MVNIYIYICIGQDNPPGSMIFRLNLNGEFGDFPSPTCEAWLDNHPRFLELFLSGKPWRNMPYSFAKNGQKSENRPPNLNELIIFPACSQHFPYENMPLFQWGVYTHPPWFSTKSPPGPGRRPRVEHV